MSLRMHTRSGTNHNYSSDSRLPAVADLCLVRCIPSGASHAMRVDPMVALRYE